MAFYRDKKLEMILNFRRNMVKIIVLALKMKWNESCTICSNYLKNFNLLTHTFVTKENFFTVLLHMVQSLVVMYHFLSPKKQWISKHFLCEYIRNTWKLWLLVKFWSLISLVIYYFKVYQLNTIRTLMHVWLQKFLWSAKQNGILNCKKMPDIFLSYVTEGHTLNVKICFPKYTTEMFACRYKIYTASVEYFYQKKCLKTLYCANLVNQTVHSIENNSILQTCTSTEVNLRTNLLQAVCIW